MQGRKIEDVLKRLANNRKKFLLESYRVGKFIDQLSKDLLAPDPRNQRSGGPDRGEVDMGV